VILPFVLTGFIDDPVLHRICAENYCRHLVPVTPAPLVDAAPYPHEKIRIAYLSADFQHHATAILMAELFERHDRERFELHALSFGEDDGTGWRERLVKAFDHFHDVRLLTDEASADLLRSLEIDIAIDLKGYTALARPEILSWRPAPVQVNYLGYPGTMGAAFIDYVVGDRIVTPSAHEPFYAEKIVQLPDCYQANDSTRRIADQAPTRAEAGLPEGGFVFCSFNIQRKLSAPVFAVWMRLLAAVPGSVLWLMVNNEGARAKLRQAAEASGIAVERIVFADRTGLESHLARHRLADLFLDTLPYNSHTTASDALWAGLPLVTCMGKAFPARVAASLLEAVGLPELITQTLEEYEALALALARDPERLAGLRQKLGTNRLVQPLFDTGRFCRHFEAALITMHQIAQNGEAPRAFAVQP
jgi:predicted O-linked N-acetylglucosamine transferase (SPINDLY family)